MAKADFFKACGAKRVMGAETMESKRGTPRAPLPDIGNRMSGTGRNLIIMALSEPRTQ